MLTIMLQLCDLAILIHSNKTTTKTHEGKTTRRLREWTWGWEVAGLSPSFWGSNFFLPLTPLCQLLTIRGTIYTDKTQPSVTSSLMPYHGVSATSSQAQWAVTSHAKHQRGHGMQQVSCNTWMVFHAFSPTHYHSRNSVSYFDNKIKFQRNLRFCVFIILSSLWGFISFIFWKG